MPKDKLVGVTTMLGVAAAIPSPVKATFCVVAPVDALDMLPLYVTTAVGLNLTYTVTLTLPELGVKVNEVAKPEAVVLEISYPLGAVTVISVVRLLPVNV